MTMTSGLRRFRAFLLRSTGHFDPTGRSASPLNRDYGYSRGTPVDRYYIEQFLARHSADVRGHVLEIGDDSYSRRFGGGRIERQDVLYVSAAEPRATIVGDLSAPGVLPPQTFDCIILTQTLHLIFDLAQAIKQLRQSLRPGGTVLITVPGITAIHGSWKDSWYWSLTEASLSRLLCQEFDAAKVEVLTCGNFLAATAFLQGAAVEELDEAELDRLDAAYPVIVAGRARA